MQIIGKGLAIASGILVARYIGPEQYGLYGFALSIISLLVLPVVAGMPNLLVKEIANYNKENKAAFISGLIIWSRLYVFGSSICVISLVYIVLMFKNESFDSMLVSLLMAAVCLIPLRGALTIQGALLNGFRKPALSQLATQVFAPLLILCGLLYSVYFGSSLNALSVIKINILSLLVSVFLIYFISERKLKYKSIIPKFEHRKWYSLLLPFSLVAIVLSVNNELATVLLGVIGGNESVAYFKVAMHAMTLIAFGLSSVNTVIMPDIARSYKEGDVSKTQQLLTSSVRISSLFSVLMVTLLLMYGKELIGLLFGAEYLPAYPLLVILSIGQLFNVLMGSVGLVLNMTGNEKLALKSSIYLLIASLVLLPISIFFHSELGASITVSFLLIVWNVLRARDVIKNTGLVTWLK